MTEHNTKPGTYSALTGFKRAVPIILLALAVFCGLCFITQNTGAFGRVITNVFLGLFSIGGYFIPFLLAVHAFFYASDIYRKRTISRTIFSFIALLMISTITHTITYFGTDYSYSITKFYTDGVNSRGGGALGGTLAWVLTAVFGQVGLIIITILIFALYITYFFAGGRSRFSKLLWKILTGISNLFSGDGKKEKPTKAEKNEIKKSRERAEKQDELSDDEFFAADNRMQEFSIPELGINEVRSNKDVESNPVLQDKVHHKSAYDDETTPPKTEPRPTATAEPTSRRRINMDYSTNNSVHELFDSVDSAANEPKADDIVYEAPPKQNASFGLDQNAKDVFTNDFEPFDFKLNEELSNKQSSKAPKSYEKEPEGIAQFSEPILNIDEEEIEKARRRADFEMKKKAAMEARERYNKANSETETPPVIEIVEPVADENKAPTPEKTAEPFIPEYIKEDREFKTYTVPEQPPVVVDFTEEEAASVREELKISRTMLNPTPSVTEIPEKPIEKPQEEYRYTSTPVEEPAQKTEYEPVQAPPKAEPAYSTAKPEEEAPLEFDFETNKDDESAAIDELFGSLDVDEGFIEEEIPEEEQNKDVKEYRKMFPFLDDEKEPEEPQEPTVEEDDDDDNDVPFEFTPIVSPAVKKPEPPQEKKEEKPKVSVDYSDYVFPSLDLLARGKVEEDPDQEMEKNQNAEILVDSLLQFNVRVSIKGIDRGPRITRYEIVPARGVKVSSVINLFNDIALKLGAEGIRMEAPIPGKSAIGVEIPNKHPSTVLLRDLVESDEFIRAGSKTMCCLGKDVTGNPVFADIAKMPHVLVAGATGMGKSVCINAILMSILYKARPDEVKFIMIDPKKVEFNGYNGIPHLLIPVVTDVKQAAGALMWAVEQMEKRYDMLEKLEVKKIDDYNAKVRENPELGEPMAKIIIVVDELNDIMLQVRKPAEDLIMSIAQKARAAGIHLIIGTQRPSVDVITGVIKANIPTRISCKVASYNDSKTILEQAGAEKLLNNGDMLYVSAGAPKALRVQGAFVSDSEVIAIMKHIKSQAKGNIYDEQALEDINRAAQKCSKGKGSDDDFDDEDSGENAGILNDQQFLDAVDLAIRSGKISTSLIQRKISIGYGKAAKFIDYMEEMGIVSEPNGQKPRNVLLTKDGWHEMLARRSLD